MATRIVFCKKCNATYSTDKFPADNCPDCRSAMLETGMSQEEWQSKTVPEKTALKEEWSAVSTNGTPEVYLKQIAEATQVTAHWVKFIGIVVLIGIIAAIISFAASL